MKVKTSAVIFGGTGFIGAFFSQYLLENKYVDQIYLVDIESADEKNFKFRRNQITGDQRIRFIRADVRKNLDFKISGKVKIIANFAAIHREPGHQKSEYFETNINGADFVCKFSERVKCKNIIFTSSISPYGSSEGIKDECSLPLPDSPYGSSKLVAEKIHQIWQVKDKNRYLTIVRPGVVFGPGEGGNVSRLIKAVIHKYFCYIGNKNTIKAGTYVKELCRAMLWVHQRQKKENVVYVLFNMTMNSCPTVEDYVKTICKTAKINRNFFNLPFYVILGASYLISSFANLMNIKHPFSSVRIKKIIRSNIVLPNYLNKKKYKNEYTLESAFDDWKKSCPEDWN